MKNTRLICAIIALCLITSIAHAQTDTLVFKTGELIVGELKGMDKNVVSIETAYSDSDFKIEWDAVSKILSMQNYLITLDDGRRINATIRSENDDGVVILDDGTRPVQVDYYDIVYFNPINQSFWNQFSASIDIGFNVTKANNLIQFNTRTAVGYLTRRWQLTADYNTVLSKQDSIADTNRMDANIEFKVFLQKDWYVFVSNDFLQNDEQKLQLRSNTQLGIGNYIIHSNNMYLSIFGGAAYNNETFTENSSPDRQTAEAFGGSQLNLFNTGDLSLVTSAIAYPNLTESGRLRVDFKFDIKYDLPLDFYIKAGTTVNYDNQPAEGGQTLDYVIQTGIGWEW